ASDIQHAVTWTHTRQFDGETLPQAVHAAGQQIVHQVVLGGYRVEYLGDLVCFLAFRNVLEAEMSGRFAVVGLARIVHVAVTEIRVAAILNPWPAFVLARGRAV